MDDADRLREAFERLLQAASPTLTESELAETRDFLDHNEMGLALEALVDNHRDDRKTAPAPVKKLVADAARLMGVHPQFLLSRLDRSNRPMDLPPEIEAAIDRIYRRGDQAYVRSRQVPSDQWRPILAKAAGEFILRDLTDFNYGLAHVYYIYLSTDPRAGGGSVAITKELLSDIQVLDFVGVSISVVVPFFTFTFGTYRLVNDSVADAFPREPRSDGQRRLADTLRQVLTDQSLQYLPAALADLVVPDVETELREPGTATVLDLMFGE